MTISDRKVNLVIGTLVITREIKNGTWYCHVIKITHLKKVMIVQDVLIKFSISCVIVSCQTIYYAVENTTNLLYANATKYLISNIHWRGSRPI